jgi:hypothetical protein
MKVIFERNWRIGKRIITCKSRVITRNFKIFSEFFDQQLVNKEKLGGRKPDKVLAEKIRGYRVNHG